LRLVGFGRVHLLCIVIVERVVFGPDVSPLIAAAFALHVADMEIEVAGARKLEVV